jgi:hypothetical protein
MKIIKNIFLILMFLLFITGQAYSIPLLPGDTVSLSGTTVADRPELAGLVIEDILRPFSMDFGGIIVTGIVQERVVHSDIDNVPIFEFRIFNDPISAGSIPFIVLEKFTGYSTDVDYIIDGISGINPDTAFRLPIMFDGEEVRFDFHSGIAPGESSSFFFIKTNATEYADTGLAFIGGVNTNATISSFEPIPEPSTMLLLGSGLLSLVAFRRKVNE